MHPALADEALVDGAEAALEGRVDGRAERDGLAVHRAAGGDDEVGVGDQGLRVDRALGDDEAAGALQLGALVGDARQDDGLGLVAQAAQDVAEEVVLEAVVEGDRRRRADDGERLGGIEWSSSSTAGSGSKSER